MIIGARPDVYPYGHGLIMFQNLTCNGSEPKLSDCDFIMMADKSDNDQRVDVTIGLHCSPC